MFFFFTETLESRSAESIRSNSYQAPSTLDADIILQLKEKFMTTNDRDEKYRILTTLPRDWTAYRIRKEFGISQHFAEKAEELLNKEGVMSVPVKRLTRASLSKP